MLPAPGRAAATSPAYVAQTRADDYAVRPLLSLPAKAFSSVRLGSLLRWLTGRLIDEHDHGDFPVGTFQINV